MEDIVLFVKSIQEEYPFLSAVALGIPGAVDGTEIRHLPKFPGLLGNRLAEMIRSELKLDVFIENDTNAIAFAEVGKWENFAHIIYVEEDQCIGVGIVLQGQVFTGGSGCAGELDYLCENLEDREDTFVTAILAITCVLNLPDILISGDFCTRKNVKKIQERLCERIPKERIPELHVVEDMKGMYAQGLLRRILSDWSERM
ncbi:MAG: ROK family protein [Lachnospiraceae bacterium]|nr:ROK family protein [Lachnospiraceae bacterium]